MKKKLILILIIIFIGLNIPVRYQLKDGGSIVYKSVLWSYEKVHSMNAQEGYDVGTRFDILGISIIDNVKPEKK